MTELGVRTFTGSRDIPKDVELAKKLFDFATTNMTNKHANREIMDVSYFEHLVRKNEIN